MNSITNWLGQLDWTELGRGLLVLAAGLTLARLVRRGVYKLARSRFDDQTSQIAARVAFIGLVAVTIATTLRHFGFDLSVLLGAAGILTVAVGFASQTSASNIISGVFLLFERPFVVGDTIRVGETTGVVLSIDLMSAKLRTFDNLFVRVPNETLVKSVIVNLSHFPVRRFDIQLRIGLDDDYVAAKKIIENTLSAHPLVLEEPAWRIFVLGYGEAWLNVQVSVWAVQESFLKMRDEVQVALKEALHREGIRLPVPERVLRQSAAMERETK